MRTMPEAQPASRISLRPFLAGAVVVALAIAGLALLSEAFASGGQTVYLANIAPGGKDFPAQPSIVVTGSGAATAPAEQAIIQLLIVRAAPFSQAFAADTPAPAANGTAGSIAPVIDAILTLGMPEGAIEVVSSPSLISVCSNSAQCSAVRVEVTVDRPNLDALNAIVNAAGEAAGKQELTVQDVGVGYGVADCRPLHEQARTAAATDARNRAEAQARVLGVALGSLVVSSETAPTDPEAARDCAPVRGTNVDAWWTPGSVGLTVPAFDPQAAPEVVAVLQVTLAFAIRQEASSSP
ncbi:MAG: hypothetical protein QOF33_3677 [Thermomicrobiales bacterium]|jgi:uncharacterized protein YggE|nr:hypothetical protein [Thermomicrobiales bacterium]